MMKLELKNAFLDYDVHGLEEESRRNAAGACHDAYADLCEHIDTIDYTDVASKLISRLRAASMRGIARGTAVTNDKMDNGAGVSGVLPRVKGVVDLDCSLWVSNPLPDVQATAGNLKVKKGGNPRDNVVQAIADAYDAGEDFPTYVELFETHGDNEALDGFVKAGSTKAKILASKKYPYQCTKRTRDEFIGHAGVTAVFCKAMTSVFQRATRKINGSSSCKVPNDIKDGSYRNS